MSHCSVFVFTIVMDTYTTTDFKYVNLTAVESLSCDEGCLALSIDSPPVYGWYL